MKDTVEALIQLQAVDDEIRGHKLRRDELAANLDRLKTILTQMGTELDEKRERLAEVTHFYEEKQVEFSPGDVLAIYSDGVTEAGVGGEDMFGEERLSSVVAEHRADGALKVQEAICEAVDAFVDGEAMDDDLTLVIIAAKR